MFAEMSGDEFVSWKKKDGRKKIAQYIQKPAGIYVKDNHFLSHILTLSSVPNENYQWNLKAKQEGDEDMRTLSLRNFIQNNNLIGKTYKEYLNTIEIYFHIPPSYLIGIAKKESQGDTMAVSSSYAFGLFQLLPVISDNHNDSLPEFHGNINPFNPYLSAFRAAEKLVELKNSNGIKKL